MPSPIAATRLWRSRRELTEFDRSVAEWHKTRSEIDPFKSALDALKQELDATSAKLREYLGKDDISVAEAYGVCARFDTALGWLRRVFAFFRDKIDQRDGSMSQALRAADEVVWSSFRAFSAARNEPAPIPYFEAQYSPAAIRRDRSVAALVRRDSDFEFLRDYLKTLPIPLLRLPMTTIGAPWTLVIIGHEAGHFVQPLVEEGYTESFAKLVSDTARGAGGSDDDAAAWAACAGEIFADWYSIGVMGPWALWAMAQFELADAASMRERRTASGYPSAVVRLELLRQLGDALSRHGITLGSDVAKTLGVSLESGADPTDAEKKDRAIATALAKRLAGESLNGRPFASAVGYRAADHEDGQQVALWAGTLTRKNSREPKRELWEARYIAAASARVAANAKLENDVARAQFTESLAQDTFKLIINSAEEGKRGANETTIEIADPGQRLSSLLLGFDLPSEMVRT